ncbi:MAG: dockerin type I repeat-containing protein [Oscillospiraceae bacterium]|nr:dockerin type I repeat-containing protein [Oscillospiraceae bacterium]
MKLFKKSISVLMSILIITSAAVGLPSVSGVETPTQKATTTVNGDDVTFESESSVGNLISSALEENQENESQETIANKILDVTVSGKTAAVSFNNSQSCNIIVAIYDNNGKKMLASGMSTIKEKDAGLAEITINAETMPQYFYVKAFILDEKNNPLNSCYESNKYTKEFQDFLAKTTDDFADKEVYNLDQSDSNNFAVFDDTAVNIKSSTANAFVSKDESTNTYIFSNIDEKITSLNTDDIFYFKNNNEYEIIKVKSIAVDGDKATIVANDDVDLDEVFSYVKIDTAQTYDEAEVDMSNADEGVTYEGTDDYEWFDENSGDNKKDVYPSGGFPNIDISKSKSLKFSIGKTFKNKEDSKSVDVRGSLTLSEKMDFSIYIYTGTVQVDFSLESKAKASVDITGKLDIKKIKLADINIPTGISDLTVGVEANFLVGVEGELSFNATLSSTLGFSIDSKTKVPKNTSKPLTVDTDIQVSGNVFIGIEVDPNVKAFAQILQLSVPIKFGGKINGETRNRVDTTTEKHLCSHCVNGTVSGVLELGFKLKVDFKLVDFSAEVKVLDFEVNLFKFYVSSEIGFGKGECPNNSYLIVFNVVNSASKPIAGANVGGNTTDSNGVVKVFYNTGKQNVTVSKSDYNTKDYSFEVTGTDTITIKLYKTGENSNADNSNTPGNIETKVNYLTKRIYLTDNTDEFYPWSSFSIKYTSDMNTWQVAGMNKGGYNRYGQDVYYYDLPSNTTHVQFFDPGSYYDSTGVVTLSPAFSDSYDNAYYFSSENVVSLWPEKDFPQMPGIDKYYRDVYVKVGRTIDITPSNYDASAGLEYSQVSNTSVAKRVVSENRCTVQGLKAGTATITITPKGNTSSLDVGKSVTVVIHVQGNMPIMLGSYAVGADSEENENDASSDTKIDYYTVSKSDLVPNAEYALLILKGSESDYQLNTDSMLYIDQTKADSDGNVVFVYYGDFSTEDYVVLIFGQCNHTLGDWKVVNEATSDEDGLRIKSCIKCDEVIESEIIDKNSSIDIPTPSETRETEEIPTATTATHLPNPTTDPSTSIQSGLLGDVDNDSVIDIRDATIIQKYIARIPVTINLENSDVNKDGDIDIADATRIQKYLSQVISQF